MALADNLTAFYNLEDETDSFASYDLTNTGAVTFTAAKIDNGANFTPDDALNNDSVIGAMSYPYSISAWVKFDSLATGEDQAVFCIHDGTNDYHIIKLRDSDNKIIFRSNNAGSAADVDTGITAVADTWYHIVLVMNSATNIDIYVNNVLTNDGVAVFTANTPTLFDMGTLGRASLWYLDGLMDLVGLWDRALVVSDVSSLYNSGDGLAYPFTTPPEPDPTTYTIKQAMLKTDYPIADGIIARTTTQQGHVMSLVPENSLIDARRKVGL
jgi:hypothetical protein